MEKDNCVVFTKDNYFVLEYEERSEDELIEQSKKISQIVADWAMNEFKELWDGDFDSTLQKLYKKYDMEGL